MGADELEQMMLRGDTTTMDDIVQMTAKPADFWDSKNYSAATKDGVVLQPVYGTTSSGHGEEGQKYEYGPVTGVKRYKEGQTKPGQTYEVLDPATGKVVGRGVFEEQSKGFFGDAWSGLKTAAADLGPILQFTPLAPFVRAIGALSAAEQGNILGALASGLPLADKIPGLDKATVTALQNAGKYASVASAAKSKDPMQLLNALSQTPEFGGKVPPELKTIGEYASKAGALQRASKGDINALLGLAKGVTAPGKSYFPGYDAPSTGEEGFFDVGGEGYVEPEAGDADSYIQSLIGFEEGLPKDVTEFLPASEVIRERTSLEDRYPAPEGQTGYDTTPKTTMSPNDMAKFLEANIDDPGRIEMLMQDYFPDLYRQTIDVTGTLPKTDVIIPDWDFMEEPDRTPGSPTDTTPGTVLPDDDRTSGTTPAGGTKTTGTKTTAKPGMSTEDLMKLLLAMQGQRPEQEEDYRLFAGQPLGYELMYGLRG